MSQLYYQLFYRFKSTIFRSQKLKDWLKKSSPTGKPTLLTNPVEEQFQRLNILPPDTFSFQNKTQKLAGNWFPKEQDLLWQFHLHYFDFLSEAVDTEVKAALIMQWIDEVPARHAIAWHPYPTSKRICNWIWFYSRERQNLEKSFRAQIRDSLYDQLSHLRNNLEFHLLGNHLIENLKALIVGGCFFDRYWTVRKGLLLLERELFEQLEDDGGHFERSPMYHLIVLEALYASARALVESEREVPLWLKEGIHRMARYGDIIFYQNHFPLLNDSSEEVAPPYALLRGELQKMDLVTDPYIPHTLEHLKSTGLVVYNSDPLALYFDVGPIGPDYLPGHAHNDTLGVLLYYQGEPILTDSGIYEYKEGEWRHYFRSARAHNVVLIDNEEPNDIWKSFRVGYRGGPFDVSVDDTEFAANDSAYKRLRIFWRRKVKVLEHNSGVEIEDLLVNSGKPRTCEWNFHLAPGCTFEGHSTDRKVTVRAPSSLLTIELAQGDLQLEQCSSWYSDEFGKKIERPCLRASSSFPLGELRSRFRFTFEATPKAL